MTTAPISPEQQDAQLYRRVLHELIDIGMDLARLLHEETKLAVGRISQAPSAVVAPDPAAGFDRLARAVRRTVMLARALDHPPARHAGRVASRKLIIREVEDEIQREADGAQAEALHAELRERLDMSDLDDEIDHRPVADIVNDICRDLGIAGMPGARAWKRRTPAEVAILHARAAALPGEASRPSLAIAWPPRPEPNDAVLHVNEQLAAILSAARFRGK